MKKQRILFIGAGRMAEAVAAGLLHTSRSKIDEVIMSNNGNKQRLEYLVNQYEVRTTHNWRDEVTNSDVVVLAMPPEAHEEILSELSSYLTDQFIVTIAAGIGPAYLEQRLPDNTPVAWIMPNTAATIGESMSLFTLGKATTEEHRKVLEMILKGIGKSQECTEREVHQLTAITGSAPAFLYHFAEALIEATTAYGIDEQTAKQLVIQMMYGSVQMLNDKQNPGELREQVTTPGGATAEGLKVMAEHNFVDMMKKAVEATNAKAMGVK
ncbi:pyrroline-5-carboxylate reductase [Priestia megaterium]|nr:pyrroline-5-carboxylate reductase [Priestia megaterium]